MMAIHVDGAFLTTAAALSAMPSRAVDGAFITVDDVAWTGLFLCAFPSAALTGQPFVVSHGWFMQ